MATLSNTKLTYLDVANSLVDGKVETKIVEMLSQTNEMLTDAVVASGNVQGGYKTVIRDGLPSSTFRELYRGVPPSKGRRVAVTETTCMLEARSEVDKDIVDDPAELNAIRLSESFGFIESMSQTLQETLLYGNTDVQQARFMGLTPRYNSLSSAAGLTNVINMSGSGNANTSIWLVGWGEETIFMFYPKGSKAGIVHEDLGEGEAYDDAGNPYRVYKDRWQIKTGLFVKDYRYAVRIGNIDAAALKADNAGTTVRILEAMLRSINRIPAIGACRPAFYVNRTVKEMIDIHAMNRSSNVLTLAEAAGQFHTRFMGIPIRLCDKISNNEANIAA